MSCAAPGSCSPAIAILPGEAGARGECLRRNHWVGGTTHVAEEDCRTNGLDWDARVAHRRQAELVKSGKAASSEKRQVLLLQHIVSCLKA
eukprot:5996850-Amphidinium_carterae.1